MVKPSFNFEDFDLFVGRTSVFQFSLYEADAVTELVLEATDVIRFKLWQTHGGAPDLDFDSKALLTATFTADAGTDTCTSTAHGLVNNDAVRLTTTGTLPAGLSLNTTYWVIGATANTFQLSATQGGGAIDITDAGTGTHTFTQTKSQITVDDLGTPSTTPAKVSCAFDQTDTDDLTAGNYNGELSIVDDSDNDKIKPLARGNVRVVGSSVGGNIGL